MSLATKTAEKINKMGDSDGKIDPSKALKYLLNVADSGKIVETLVLGKALSMMFKDGSVLAATLHDDGNVELTIISARNILAVLRYYAPYTELLNNAKKMQ